MSVGLCLVGYGAMAQFHAEIFRAEGVILRSVVGRLPEETKRFAADFGFRHHTTELEAALADDDVSIIVIASPNSLHYEQVMQSLLAGKHVLVEIPLAMSYADGVQLVDLARRQGCMLMACHSQRFIPSLAMLRKRVAAGSLQVYHLMGRHGTFRRENVGWTGRQRSWTDNILWHHGCHLVDFSMWFLGANEVEVVGQVAKPDLRTGIPQDLDIMLRTPNDQLVSLSLSYHTHLSLDEYLIVGEEESLRFEHGRLIGPDGLIDDPSEIGLSHDRLSWEAQNREFLTALRECRPPEANGADVLPALAVLQEIQDRFLSPTGVES